MHAEFLGFDVRVAEVDLERTWDQRRRQTFLLRPEIRSPLSVDRLVWPSRFRYSGTITPPGYERYEVVEFAPAEARQSALRLWSDFEEMRKEFVRRGKRLDRDGTPVMVKLFTKETARHNEFWRAVLSPEIVPEVPLGEWLPLGYDVADRDMISGLSNCGYGPEKKSLQETWSSSLNEDGLFRNLEDAFRFRDVTDKRVGEHAPFYVYGLLRGPSIVTA